MEIFNQIRKTMDGIKAMGGNFQSNKKNMDGIKEMGGNFQLNKWSVSNKNHRWKFSTK